MHTCTFKYIFLCCFSDSIVTFFRSTWLLQLKLNIHESRSAFFYLLKENNMVVLYITFYEHLSLKTIDLTLCSLKLAKSKLHLYMDFEFCFSYLPFLVDLFCYAELCSVHFVYYKTVTFYLHFFFKPVQVIYGFFRLFLILISGV